jgi:hypothetical protein
MCLVSFTFKRRSKGRLFRFKNYWLEHEHFVQILSHGWNIPTHQQDKAENLEAKFKNLRRVLKEWHKKISNLASSIANVKDLISHMDMLEEFRDLSLYEWDFREILKQHLDGLLQQQNTYWKQRGTIKWVRFGDECTRFFHANATIKNIRKMPSPLLET